MILTWYTHFQSDFTAPNHPAYITVNMFQFLNNTGTKQV